MAAAKPEGKMTLVVRESFVGKVDKVERVFRSGESIEADDPAVKKWPHLFMAPEFRNKVEQATAAPGELR